MLHRQKHQVRLLCLHASSNSLPSSTGLDGFKLTPQLNSLMHLRLQHEKVIRSIQP